MAKALDTEDQHMLTIAAHTLKGSSLNLGAKQLGAACFKLEELGRSGLPLSASMNINEIQSEFEQVKAILLTFKQSKQ
jgi:HPt (histidine-containing phosphotransfer) domain-containing protein